MHLTRAEISACFDDEQLLALAHRIATVGESVADQIGINEAFNVLVNATNNEMWNAPVDVWNIAAWKGHSHGFSGATNGLSIRFDPFVDAALYAVRRNYGEGTTVLVLTDYYPWQELRAEYMADGKWAEREVARFLNGFEPSNGKEQTGVNILKAVTGKQSINQIRNSPECVEEAFFQHRLLLWNYFPFARGGTEKTGHRGLPGMRDGDSLEWMVLCEAWLAAFCAAVNAKCVAFAANAEVKAARAKRLENASHLPAGIHEVPLCHPSFRTTGWRDERQFRQLLEHNKEIHA